MKKVTPFLWFDNQAEEAMNFYVSIFKDARVIDVSRNGDAVLFVRFQLRNQEFMALNAGPYYKFTEAVSFFVDCDDQEEVDYFWKGLAEGGEESRCGWLKDKFGLSWQIIPKALGEMMGDPDREKAARVTQAMMQMAKIDIALLEKAYNAE